MRPPRGEEAVAVLVIWAVLFVIFILAFFRG